MKITLERPNHQLLEVCVQVGGDLLQDRPLFHWMLLTEGGTAQGQLDVQTSHLGQPGFQYVTKIAYLEMMFCTCFIFPLSTRSIR